MKTEIIIGELFDGGFTEYYLAYGVSDKKYYLRQFSYHYNAGIVNEIAFYQVDKVRSKQELDRLVLKYFPMYIDIDSSFKETHYEDYFLRNDNLIEKVIQL